MSTSNDSGFESFKEPEEQGKIVKCPSCGGNMTFDPATQTLYCEYCGGRVDFEKDKEVQEIAIEKAFQPGGEKLRARGLRSYRAL